MLDVKVNNNLKTVQKRYNKFISKFPSIVRQGLEQAGIQLKEIILNKTDRGIDQTGGRFPAYSFSYSQEKGKTTVNLQDTNRMLQSIDSKLKSKNKVQLYFRSQTEAKKAYWHQTGQGKLPVRKFFGFNNKTERLIQKTFHNFIKKQMKQFKI